MVLAPFGNGDEQYAVQRALSFTPMADSRNTVGLWKHLRAILLLPVMAAVVIPTVILWLHLPEKS
jgi:hypothetical protein